MEITEQARQRLQDKFKKFQERERLLTEKRVRLDEQFKKAESDVLDAEAQARELTGTDDLSIIDAQVAEVYASLEQMLMDAEAIFTKAGV